MVTIDDHAGHLVDAADDDQDRHQDVADSHHRDHDVGDLGDALDAAEDHEGGDRRQHDTGPEALDADAVLHGVGDGVALEGVEAQREGRDQADRIDHGQPFVLLAEAVQDILRRSAAIGAVPGSERLMACAREHSTRLVAIPTKAIIHIQNAPGPPSEIATATPAMLPPPTRPLIKRAARELTRPPSVGIWPGKSTRNMRLKKRSCTKPVAKMKNEPNTTRKGMSDYLQVRSLVALKMSSIKPITSVLSLRKVLCGQTDCILP